MENDQEKKEHKCICCGHIKESAKVCVCPTCGYPMFEMPYERSDKLLYEIKNFILKTEIGNIQQEELFAVKKQKDDNRFPNFDKIQNYVCSAEKTEQFIMHLERTVEQIEKYKCNEFKNKYKIDFSSLNKKTEQSDEILTDALKKLGYAEIPEFKKTELPKTELFYREYPNEEYSPFITELLKKLPKLIKKIYEFIRLNNIYGKAHMKKPPEYLKIKKDKNGNKIIPDYIKEIQKCIEKTNTVLNKRYEVDIFSDGTEEMTEMIDILWKDIEVTVKSPSLSEQYRYYANDKFYDTDEILKYFSGLFSERYVDVNNIIAENFLEGKTEDELFELYNKMIKADKFNVMGINSSGLVNIGESEKKLNSMIGLSTVKESIQKIKAYTIANKEKGTLNLHMCFYGNPGTGKTEVARIIAGILYENKILPTKNVVEVDRSGLVGQYLGETPIKTMSAVREAMGGVLFVDEAYALATPDAGFDYGHEAVATLIKAMEDYRGKFCVILAGYKNQMDEMIATNPGFRSRIQFEIDFPNYSRDELGRIADLMLENRKYILDGAAREMILDITDVKRKEPNFANAREMRNILDQVIMCQNLRCMGTDEKEIGIYDVNKYIADANIALPVTGSSHKKKILTGEEELESLIGLAEIKRTVKKIKAYAKRNAGNAELNMHMCFYGNPGTGKTEVARIISRILADAGVLPEAKLVETDAKGLIGKYVGETAPKTSAKIKDAMGGVLFIDEAYSLNIGSGSRDYGEEAIATLLKEMEDRRGKFCVILAGYKNEMQEMLSSNPGFESRIQFKLDFPDYSREELGEIAKRFLKKKKYEITEDALDKLLDIAEWYRERPNFANARTLRNIIDQVIMNQNLRADDNNSADDYLIILSDVEDYISDENIDLTEKRSKKTIGFIV